MRSIDERRADVEAKRKKALARLTIEEKVWARVNPEYMPHNIFVVSVLGERAWLTFGSNSYDDAFFYDDNSIEDLMAAYPPLALVLHEDGTKSFHAQVALDNGWHSRTTNPDWGTLTPVAPFTVDIEQGWNSRHPTEVEVEWFTFLGGEDREHLVKVKVLTTTEHIHFEGNHRWDRRRGMESRIIEYHWRVRAAFNHHYQQIRWWSSDKAHPKATIYWPGLEADLSWLDVVPEADDDESL